MNRTFTNLTIRTIDEDQRVIEGWATTNVVDRVGDVVEPSGAQFELPIPLLLDHNHAQAVGEVELAEVTPKGIRFLARVTKIAEPGPLKDLVDTAWQAAKYGLRKAVSIGFQPLEWEALPNGGQRFTRWDWFELSLCTVPANPEAVVDGVKRAPVSARAAKQSRVVRLADPVGKELPVVRLSDPVAKPKSTRVVRLTESDKRRGKMKAAAARHIATLKRHGIPLPRVKVALTAAEEVEAVLAAAREKRKQAAMRKAMSGRVSLRDPSGRR